MGTWYAHQKCSALLLLLGASTRQLQADGPAGSKSHCERAWGLERPWLPLLSTISAMRACSCCSGTWRMRRAG